LLGALGVLVPLELFDAGWDSTGVAGTFLAAACIGIPLRPIIGRVADRRGLTRSYRQLLLAFVPGIVLLAAMTQPLPLSTLGATSVVIAGVLWAPAMALVSHAYQERGITQVLGFSMMNLTSGIGVVIGAIAAGALADYVTNAASYAALLVLVVATSVGLAPRWRRRTRTRRLA
jgi:MFS family permease